MEKDRRALIIGIVTVFMYQNPTQSRGLVSKLKQQLQKGINKVILNLRSMINVLMDRQ